ncbi:hypothetical protein SPOG_04939 [Schizosaccharomyces cryophilus OY26]|uniref:Uncharacterized protein n=1 Tax=Schizosaccharomyces cryophilus (strain OY26 / ATCC MYA-4695 / CBS 11777 / NBRC 106824 / NRRL Y48691) TaxID=653667 RepID=S9XB52_SCHCR|nr:uncharacterized protein SPOG_04939 [Schizosaccharomyces cryophilus OY26]EPY50971.1 hypothetical protein SPOG_04939 [Schizosaccharomyces cryophilus OY26]
MKKGRAIVETVIYKRICLANETKFQDFGMDGWEYISFAFALVVAVLQLRAFMLVFPVSSSPKEETMKTGLAFPHSAKSSKS